MLAAVQVCAALTIVALVITLGVVGRGASGSSHHSYSNASSRSLSEATADRRQTAEHIVVANWLGHTTAVRQSYIATSKSPAAVCETSHIFRASAQCLDFDRFGDIVRRICLYQHALACSSYLQGDGGKWVCGMHTKLSHQRVVYSFGSNYQVCLSWLLVCVLLCANLPYLLLPTNRPLQMHLNRLTCCPPD